MAIWGGWVFLMNEVSHVCPYGIAYLGLVDYERSCIMNLVHARAIHKTGQRLTMDKAPFALLKAPMDYALTGVSHS